jgi:hypothetical protein
MVAMGEELKRLWGIHFAGIMAWICSRCINEYLVRTPDDLIQHSGLLRCSEASHVPDHAQLSTKDRYISAARYLRTSYVTCAYGILRALC